MGRNKLKDTTELAHLIQSYAQTRELNKGKQLHAQLIRGAYPLCTFLTNHLINMYSRSGELGYAMKLFDKMPQRNVVSWTAMISGFSQNRRFGEALNTFCLMRNVGEALTQFAFSSVLRACVSHGSVELGTQLHSLAMKCGFSNELFVGSNLADMYSKCGIMHEACKVFNEMPYKDQVLWTSLIDGYVKNGDCEEALLAYKKMVINDIVIDQHVLCSTLSACSALKFSHLGKSLHSTIVKLGFELDTILVNVIIDMYSKYQDMESALKIFQIDSHYRNIVSCTALIDGYVEMDQIEDALSTFVDLRRQGIEPNEFTFSSLVKGCANQAALEQGIQLHGQVVKFNFDRDPYVASTLVDMYGKCGLFDHSTQVFEEIENPNNIAWNSLLGAFAQHGLGRNAIETFNRMIDKGVRPNAITFVSLLTGCSHTGMIEEGLNFFHSMDKIYGVVPREEHYSCVIDLLGRAGKLKEAENFINNMPFEPNAFGWCSFLGACKVHGDKERGKLAAEKLMKLEPENGGTHVLLSNIYAKEGQWEDVRSLRKMIRDGNIKKLPGYSWVDIQNKTHIFGAEDCSHPQKKEIYEKLDSLLDQIKNAGYVSQTELVLVDMNEALKEKHLHHHSERIAVAFSLISMPIGKPIIVKKNLRVCADCHSAIKLISKVTGRIIIVRDSSRFHHFSNGSCSCGDYW
ncbi:putative pentatricopeptide repeat-containing protein At5g52630 [Prosopis cineraria]|uniref:putative pentatricopeptide repeat-containing protein At5g52630 n=1 Tax=Prosopis cineraria TaxID=364024 RepID=UPI0024106198|nr:putative pentatricopeptide repeat-containing protein At5g52630 [Prosopis cineraria]XP_054800752.1 putative pentatricopeptide repeat-containing protein At5g52630 [Prosopis cineraria]